MHYHIHANKTYLHGRIRKKVGNLNKQLNNAKFEKEIVKSKIGRDANPEANDDESDRTLPESFKK